MTIRVGRISSIGMRHPRVKKVSEIRKAEIRIRAVRVLTSFFKDLFDVRDFNVLISERKRLLDAKDRAIIRLIEEKEEENKKVILSLVEEIYEKIKKLNMKVYTVFHEIPISEGEIKDWKKEIFMISDYVYAIQLDKAECHPYVYETLNSKLSRLMDLREAVNRYIVKLAEDIDTFQKELNNIEMKHSIGLLDEEGYMVLRKGIEDMIKAKTEELEYLKNYNMQISLQPQVQSLKENLHKISQQITQVEQKYRSNEIDANEYNRLIEELRKEENELSEQIAIEERHEDYIKKLKMLEKSGVITESLDKLLV